MLRPFRTDEYVNLDRGSRGYSLVEVLVAAGIVGILALAVMTIFAWSFEGQRTIFQRQSAMNLQLNVTSLLGDRRVCELNFAGRSVSPGAPDTLTDLVSSVSPTRVAVVREGDTYESNTVRMTNISLQNWHPYATSGNDSHRGTITVEMQLQPTNKTLGATNMMRTVTLLVETNGYPPVTPGATNLIRTCVAIGSDQNSIWTLKNNGDIFYSGFNVGIGTNSPSQMLHVEGRVLASAYLHSSDARLKNDIRTAPGLAALKQLRGVSFTWKKSGERSLGVLAQDVERVFPEAVATDPRTSLKSVSYHQLIGPLIEGVNELARENERLDRELAEIEKRRAIR